MIALFDLGWEFAYRGRGCFYDAVEGSPELVEDALFNDGNEGGGEGHAAGNLVYERAYGGFTGAEGVVGVDDFETGSRNAEEGDDFGFVTVGVGAFNFAFDGEGDAEGVFVGRGGYWQCGFLLGDRAGFLFRFTVTLYFILLLFFFQ